MAQVKINKNISPPMPVVLVGTVINNKPNFMAVGWCIRVNLKPPMIAVALNNNHFTIEGIKENKTFGISFPSSDMVELTDYCGIVSGRKEDKSKLFDIFYGENQTVPMISSFPLNLECKLTEIIELPTNTVFIGEITEAYAQEHYVENNKVNIVEIDPLLLTMPDKKYWKLGSQAGEAWKDGLKFKNNVN